MPERDWGRAKKRQGIMQRNRKNNKILKKGKLRKINPSKKKKRIQRKEEDHQKKSLRLQKWKTGMKRQHLSC